MPEPEPLPTRVWDLPTRLFHWTLAGVVTGSVVSAKMDAMVWHFRFGYAVFALLLFRLAWGLVGGRWSRFLSFLHGPGALLRYLRGRTRDDEQLDVGHNPLGSLSVFALLGVLAAQVATGLVADDEIATVGPLNRFVGTEFGLSATSWHHGWGQWAVLGLIGLHVAAIVWYLVRRRQNLVRPMLTGDKLLPPGTPASADGLAQRALAMLLALAAAAAVTWIVQLGLQTGTGT